MRSDTKKHAFEKLDKMSLVIGYPDEILNDTILDDYYKDFNIDSSSLLKTVLNYNLFTKNLSVKNLRKPIIKGDWNSYDYAVTDVNAFYEQSSNELRKLNKLIIIRCLIQINLKHFMLNV